jgi:hypothetical protein
MQTKKSIPHCFGFLKAISNLIFWTEYFRDRKYVLHLILALLENKTWNLLLKDAHNLILDPLFHEKIPKRFLKEDLHLFLVHHFLKRRPKLSQRDVPRLILNPLFLEKILKLSRIENTLDPDLLLLKKIPNLPQKDALHLFHAPHKEKIPKPSPKDARRLTLALHKEKTRNLLQKDVQYLTLAPHLILVQAEETIIKLQWKDILDRIPAPRKEKSREDMIQDQDLIHAVVLVLDLQWEEEGIVLQVLCNTRRMV